jgi:hypothetical protein
MDRRATEHAGRRANLICTRVGSVEFYLPPGRVGGSGRCFRPCVCTLPPVL